MPKLFGFQQRKVSHSGVSLLRFNSPQILETLSVPLPNSVVYPPQFIFWFLLWWLPFTGFPWDRYSVYHRKQPSPNNLSEPYTMTTWIVDISSHLSSFTFLFRSKCLTQTNDSEMAALTNTIFHFIRSLRKTFPRFFQLFIWTI